MSKQMHIPLEERRNWPRLSHSLPHRRHPNVCQSCGRTEPPLRRWREHDENDQPEPIVVVLCDPCAKCLIEPHPRLYGVMQFGEPLPGTMTICEDCVYRDGLACLHPLLKANGGPGLPLNFPPPTVAFVDGVDQKGRRFGRQMTMYRGPVHCAGRSDGTEEGE